MLFHSFDWRCCLSGQCLNKLFKCCMVAHISSLRMWLTELCLSACVQCDSWSLLFCRLYKLKPPNARALVNLDERHFTFLAQNFESQRELGFLVQSGEGRGFRGFESNGNSKFVKKSFTTTSAQITTLLISFSWSRSEQFIDLFVINIEISLIHAFVVVLFARQRVSNLQKTNNENDSHKHTNLKLSKTPKRNG